MPPSSLELPQLPKDRSRLLAARIDLYAQQDGSRTYAAIPETDDVRHGFRDITWAEFAQAIDQAAWWLDATLGTRTNEFECFAYLGARDLRYIALTVAAVKTGRKVKDDLGIKVLSYSPLVILNLNRRSSSLPHSYLSVCLHI